MPFWVFSEGKIRNYTSHSGRERATLYAANAGRDQINPGIRVQIANGFLEGTMSG